MNAPATQANDRPPIAVAAGSTPGGRHTINVLSLLRWTAALVAILSVVAILLTMLLRIGYPYELEWMEGGVLEHIARLRAGEAIYVEPSLEFVPFIYPPLYYYLSAGMQAIVGPGFLGPRLVSLLATLGTLGLIFEFVRRETRNALAAVCAVALYAVTFDVTGRWFDIARVDTLFPLFILGGAYLIRFGRHSAGLFLAGLLFTCAFFTKQSSLLFAAPLGLFCLAYRPRQFLWLCAGSILPCLVISGYLHWQTNGWFTYYIFDLPRQHPIELHSHWRFWAWDMAKNIPFALASIGIFAWYYLPGRSRRSTTVFYLALGAGGLATSWMSRIHTGAYANVLLPVFAVTAILLGLAIAGLPGLLASRQRRTKEHARPAVTAQWAEAVVLLVVILQLGIRWFNPLATIPSASDRAAGDALVTMLRQIDGDVLIPTAPYLAERAGKPSTAHLMAVADILRATKSDDIKAQLLADLNREVAGPRFQAILLYQKECCFDKTPIPEDFLYLGRIFDSPDVFRFKSGAPQFSPDHLFVCPAIEPQAQDALTHCRQSAPPAVLPQE